MAKDCWALRKHLRPKADRRTDSLGPFFNQQLHFLDREGRVMLSVNHSVAAWVHDTEI
jgi:hypothetical protein